MRFGDRLRYIRNLMGMTQKELGKKAGFSFSNSAADVRIYQYENNQKKPKPDAIKKLAEALNVDISALSDIDICTINELMHIFFELEDIYGIKIESKENSYTLCFKDIEESNLGLRSAFDMWHIKQQMLHLGLDSKQGYDLWRSRFPLDMQEHEDFVDTKLNEKFDILKEKLQKDKFSVSTLSDIIIIVRNLYDSIGNIKSYRNEHHIPWYTFLGILSFEDNELLALNEETSLEYTKFLLLVEYLNSLNIKIEKKKHTFEEKTHTDFYIYEAPFWTIVTSIEEILAIDDKDEAQIRYNSFLDLFNVPITDYRKE